MATGVFQLTCFILAGYMAFTQALRFLDNDDSSSIGYKNFNKTPVDRYPTLSICLYSPYDDGLLRIFEADLRRATEHNRLLKGEENRLNYAGLETLLSNNSQMADDPFTAKLESILYAFAFETQDSNDPASFDKHKRMNRNLPFYVSHIDPDQICFTRKSETNSNSFRKLDWVSLDSISLKELNVGLHLYIHHPGQITRSLGKPNFAIGYYQFLQLKRENSKIALKLNHVSTLRKRPDANTPCNANLQDDDTRFKQEVINQVGCIPIYWKSIKSLGDSYKWCTSPEMATVLNLIKSKDDTMSLYEPPCDYMEVSVGITQQLAYVPDYVLIELVYMDTKYQEYINSRDFGFESFWSAVGGFVGIFLGYSLLELPGSLAKLGTWCLERKIIKKHISSLTKRVEEKERQSRNPHLKAAADQTR